MEENKFVQFENQACLVISCIYNWDSSGTSTPTVDGWVPKKLYKGYAKKLSSQSLFYISMLEVASCDHQNKEEGGGDYPCLLQSIHSFWRCLGYSFLAYMGNCVKAAPKNRTVAPFTKKRGRSSVFEAQGLQTKRRSSSAFEPIAALDQITTAISQSS